MPHAISFKSPKNRALVFNSMRSKCLSVVHEYDFVYSQPDGAYSPEGFPKYTSITYKFSLTPSDVMLVRNPVNSFLGKGSYGSVDLVETESGEFLARKINKLSKIPFPENGGAIYSPSSEARIALDLGVAVDAFQGEDIDQEVILYRYLGQSLKSYLSGKKCDDQMRLSIAIKMTRIVYALHTGALSKSGQKYAHLDIKPDNFVINDKGEVSLIDFGFSTAYKGSMSYACGTQRYLLPSFHIITQQKSTVDAYALVRSLYIPPSFFVMNWKRMSLVKQSRAELRPDYPYVLTEDVKQRVSVLEEKTEFIESGVTSPCPEIIKIPELYVSLIYAKFNLGSDYRIRNSQYLTQFLTCVELLDSSGLLNANNLRKISGSWKDFETCYMKLKKLGINSSENISSLLSDKNLDNGLNIVLFREALAFYASRHEDKIKLFYCQIKLKAINDAYVLSQDDLKEAEAVLSHTYCCSRFFASSSALSGVENFFEALVLMPSHSSEELLPLTYDSVKQEYESRSSNKVYVDYTGYMVSS